MKKFGTCMTPLFYVYHMLRMSDSMNDEVLLLW